MLFTINILNTSLYVCVPKPVEYTDICLPIFIYLQELAQSHKNATEVEQLRREKADLVGEVETHKSSVRV